MACPTSSARLFAIVYGSYTEVVPKRNRPMVAQIEEYVALALMLPISTFVGLGIGYLLDKAFHTHFLYIVFMILGIAGGFLQLIRRLIEISHDDA
jgi:F0F1-type ATP synthase assembly protein I